MAVIYSPKMRLIAGPCLMESREHSMNMAAALTKIVEKYPVDFIFKASFEKANRTSGKSVRQMVAPWAADDVFRDIRNSFGCETITDIHVWYQVGLVKSSSWLQIPAYLCRQTDLIEGAAKDGRNLLIKKGQFVAPHDMKHAVDKARAAGSGRVIVAERGSSFGYNDLIVDMRGFPIMLKTAGADLVIHDATHSVQRPSAGDGVSGGNRDYIEHVARAALAAGAQGLFCEVHDDPPAAPSDSAVQIPLRHFEGFLERCLTIWEACRNTPVQDISP
jgi:2-dehydro-3-deoxyphosphooctonate aldolase (KDO 8-P synthase)